MADEHLSRPTCSILMCGEHTKLRYDATEQSGWLKVGLGPTNGNTSMASEFEKHIAMQPQNAEQSKALQLYSPPAEGGLDKIVENPGTVTTMALLVGMVGFAIGLACGQSSARSDRYWR